MIKIICDVCKAEITTKSHPSINFPRVIIREENTVKEWYEESDICHGCMISVADFLKIKMELRSPGGIGEPENL